MKENSTHTTISIPPDLYYLAIQYSKSHNIDSIDQVACLALNKLFINEKIEKMTETQAKEKYGNSAFLLPVYKDKIIYTYTLLDEEDYIDFLQKFPNKNLHLHENYSLFHLEIKSKKDTIYLHRWIMLKSYNLDNFVVDHIDNDPLNNSRKNLRILTKSQNGQNRQLRNKLGFIGVTQRGSLFYGRARIAGQRHTTSGFKTVEDAARARDDLIISLGSFGKPNFTR